MYIVSLRLYLIALILLYSAVGCSQEQKYPFIQYNKNKLHLASDSSLMLGFYKKLDDLRDGKRSKVTIMHYGGSHIQAGFWTEEMNNRFQALNNYDGGGNFAFPFKLAKANNPPFYHCFSSVKWKRNRCVNHEKQVPLGMAGIAVVNNDSAGNFGLKLDPNNHIKNFTRIKVYHNFNPSFRFSFSSHAADYVQSDSVNAGYTLFEFKQPLDSVCFYFTRVDTLQRYFVLYGFSLENDAPGFYYAGMGVNGAATDSYLRCELFGQQLNSQKPDLVIFSLGVNDVHSKGFSADTFKLNYDSLVNIIRNVSPNCAIIFTSISDNYIRRKTPNKKSALVQEAVFQLMEKHKAAVWDM